MYIITHQLTRPNADLHTYIMIDPIVPMEVVQYWLDNFKYNKKCLYNDIDVSPDSLVMTITAHWETQQDHLDYVNDPWLQENFFQLREAYWAANNITFELIDERVE